MPPRCWHECQKPSRGSWEWLPGKKKRLCLPLCEWNSPLVFTPTCTLIWLWWCWEKKCKANFHYDNLHETEEQIRYESRMLCHRRDEKIKCKQLVSGIDCCYQVQCDIHQYNRIILFCVTQLYSNVAVAAFATIFFLLKKWELAVGWEFFSAEAQ